LYYIISFVAGVFAVISLFAMLFGDNPNPLGWVFLVLSIFGTYYFYKKQKEIEEEERDIKQDISNRALDRLPGFKTTKRYVSQDGNITLAIDEGSKQLSIFPYNRLPKIYKYRDILKSEILTDGISVTSTNRGSQIGGALLGGLLVGGVGAIIGGLSGSQTSEEKVKKVELNIIVNDTAEPIHKIAFLDSGITYSKNSQEYNQAYNTAYHCHQLMAVLIRQADVEDQLKERSTSNGDLQQNVSVADELRKLAQLKDDGIISLEEFELHKKKLIG
jgi:hypothetical protein